MGKKKKPIHDAEYISYIDSGESAAVFIARDICKEIETRDKWIDAISFSVYEKEYSYHRKAFDWIIVELFPRQIRPIYDQAYSLEEKRYLTWQTAHEDMDVQRSLGYNGPKYAILCDLVKKEKEYSEKSGRPRYEWQYEVLDTKQITEEELAYIETNRFYLKAKLRRHEKPTLEMLGIKD